jgi:ATP-dependent DNA helicase RecQ
LYKSDFSSVFQSDKSDCPKNFPYWIIKYYMSVIKHDVPAAMQQFFGFSNFKGTQQAIVDSVLRGDNTFVILPTGGGKSLCYQLPAMMLEGTAIIISPLIALMKNQVDSIRGYSQNDDIAHFLNSSLNRTQIKKVKQDIADGLTKMLYVAPETLTKEENIEFFKEANVSFVAVDEAHCISEWGHDFRPEYRRIRQMIDEIDAKIPIIALTATATPKVRSDIVKTLRMEDCNVFVSSFNRDNLYYEVRAKSSKTEQTQKNIIQFVKNRSGESGIIYVQSRKSAEDVAKILVMNGVRAAPYHAGLDAKLRSATQDDFLNEDMEVIVATIAFGMGIDKPDVRFVIHYDIPKSIENYYQETGRAGRDGLKGECVAFFSYKDMHRLEKFLRDKHVAEREMGMQLMNEMTAYAETASCRREFLLHYFGETFVCERNGMCDNCRAPQPEVEVSADVVQGLKAIKAIDQNYHLDFVVEFIMGAKTKQILDYKYEELEGFACGAAQNEHYWNSVMRHAMLADFIHKDIERYGIMKVSPAGEAFLANPQPFKIRINHNYEKQAADEVHESVNAKPAALDTVLLNILKDLRKKVAKRKNIPPFVVFQDPSLNDMATQYPVNLEELSKVQGVSPGKASRYGAEFVEVIAKYVEEHDIDRPSEFVVRSVVNKSTKVAIIQAVDKKIPLEDVARSYNISMQELLEDIERIVISGTRLKIDYHIKEFIDEEVQEIIHDYFMEAEDDSAETAAIDLKDEDISFEEVQLMRIKFLSDMGN